VAVEIIQSSTGVQGPGENGEPAGTPSAGGTLAAQGGTRLGLYVPGSGRWGSLGAQCPANGDRYRLKNIAWLAFEMGVSDLVPDAAGFMPHAVLKNASGSLADPRSNLATTDGSLYSNDPYPPAWRQDLGPLVVEGTGGALSFQGGDGPGGLAGTLVITYVWERGWLMREHQARNSRGQEWYTQTFWNVPADARIYRPDFATRVRTPSNVNVDLDSGPGTTPCRVALDFGEPTSLGAYQFFVNTSDDTIPVVEFWIPR
jgi:hypothetical protein